MPQCHVHAKSLVLLSADVRSRVLKKKKNNKLQNKGTRPSMSDRNARSYWKANLRIVGTLLCVWFFISFVCGVLLADYLDNFRIGGFKLGFWMAQQGSIFGFVILIFVYIHQMDKLDHQYNLDQVGKADGPATTGVDADQGHQS